MKRFSGIIFILCVILAAGLWASDEIQLDVKEQTLSNGMTILVVEKPIAPVVSTYLRFKVGAVDEVTGMTGISHFLEHMLFKGSKIIGTTDYEAEKPLMDKIDSLAALLREEKGKLRSPLAGGSEDRVTELREQIAEVQAEQATYIIKDELWETYLRHGGTGLNASTGSDGTQYYVSLPANRLELWAFLEADRMENLVFREFYSERDVVREERRMRTETQPWGRLYEALNASAHWASPYRWGAIGWASDIENYSLADMADYFHTYYHPSNAVAAIVGDVKAEDVFALCEKYFGAIPARETPEAVFTDNQQQMGERRVEVEFDANPTAIIAWHMPQMGHPDIAALDVLSDILSRGRTSRLYTEITEKKIARAGGYISSSRYPDLFTCSVTPMGDYSADAAVDSVLLVIENLKTTPVESWEIDKVRTQADADFIRSLASNMGLARRIGNMEAMTGDWHYLIDYREEYKAVTPEDIMRVANEYLTKSNRTIVTLVKPTEEENAAAPDDDDMWGRN